jgi:hypothetical protein
MLFPTLRGHRRALVIASSVYLAIAGLGTWLAIANDIPARPMGLRTGLPVAWDFAIGLGSGLSAPLPMLIALAVLAVSVARRQSRRSLRWIGFLAWCFLVGMLVEPIPVEAIRGEQEPLVLGITVANVLLPIAILGLTIGTARQGDVRPARHAWTEVR